VLTLPDRLDPCDFIRQRGADAMRELLAGAVDALEHKVRVTTQGIDPTRDTHKAHVAVEDILATLAKAPRVQSAASGAARLREQQLLARLARQFYLPEGELWQRLNDLRRNAKPAIQQPGAAQRSDDSAAPTTRLIESIDPRQSELLEIMTIDEQLAAQALALIAPEHVASGPVRAIFNVYARLAAAGESLEFGRVMSELEDPRLKSLLVQLDEQAQQKEQHAQQPAQQRLEALLSDFEQGNQERGRRAQLAALEQQKLAPQEELDVLQDLIAQQRKRQGISSPTDG
jgi:DNA primase